MPIPEGQRPIIRPATSGDAGSIAALSRQLGYDASGAEVLCRLESLLAGDNHAVYAAVHPCGDVLGWVQVSVRELVMVDRHAEIGGLVVVEDQRGRGLGHLLMAEAEQWARSRGCTAVCVRSNAVRRAAHRFYKNLGYDQIKTQLVLRKSL
jgi:GNAT superfamily N-acetyltransferase